MAFYLMQCNKYHNYVMNYVFIVQNYSLLDFINKPYLNFMKQRNSENTFLKVLDACVVYLVEADGCHGSLVQFLLEILGQL